ncbi:50S ribosomal protein L4 [Candidatus Marsarchaeota archaeon]|nr:50S ribosomal protein L4 [Candidatus Marsarchaeota archaeon]MCL5404858.1 50S ribosomal protein L4 [Candidatus Marsarchaeota archaeon]
MPELEVIDVDGKRIGTVQLPHAFEAEPKPWLISRAALAERTTKLQPQGHYVLAGMQTTAAYFGAMSSYRTGRHVGRAIRPREKLGGGALGRVRRIPSAVSGKRAHPHMVEKKLVEYVNNKEYSNALKSAVAASYSKSKDKHTVVVEGISKLSKTKDFVKFLKAIEVYKEIENMKQKRSSPTGARKYRKLVLVVTSDKEGNFKPAGNIKGVVTSTLSKLTVSALAPGGTTIRNVIWSKNAIEGLDSAIDNAALIKSKKA